MDESPIISAMVNKTLIKALFDTAVGREGSGGSSEGHGRVIWGPVWRVNLRVNLRSILRSFLDHIWTLSRKPHKYPKNSFIWP